MHGEMFNILSHKRIANQNTIEIPSHPSQNGKSLRKQTKNTCEDAGERNPYILLLGM
jgi:hypothetical protein